jgi:putative hydrolase of the HAD superfamily
VGSGDFLKGVRAVVFDAVGTLIHPDPPVAEVYAAVGRRFGSRYDLAAVRVRFRAAFAHEEAADRAAGHRTDDGREVRRWRTIVGSVLDDVTDAEGCFRELFDHFARPAWRCDPADATALAELARRGLILGVASNFDRRLHAVFDGLPGLAPVRVRVVSAEVGWRKPAPEFFTAVVRATGCEPGEVLFVGDDFANDYEGATAAGLRAVLLDPAGRAPAGTARVSRLAELL